MAKAFGAAIVAFVVLLSVLSSTAWAAKSVSPSLAATPPQPNWSELTVKQKIVLAPLSDDWDSLEYFRQKTWLGIAARFPSITPEEQRRIQGQMQEWGKLSSEQRQLARENYLSVIQLPLEKKRELKEKWKEYSSLPEEEREKLKLQSATDRLQPKTARSVLADLLRPKQGNLEQRSQSLGTPPRSIAGESAQKNDSTAASAASKATQDQNP